MTGRERPGALGAEDSGADESGAEASGGGEPDAGAVRRVLLNAVALLGAYVLPRLFTFGAAVVAARALGVETFGRYGTVAALAVMLSIVSTLGMMQLLVREVARDPEGAPDLLGAAHLVKAVSGAAMLLVLGGLAAGPLGYGRDAVTAALLLGASYAVGSFVENLGAWVQGVERMGAWTVAQALFGLVSGGLGMTFALTTRSLVWFCAAPLIGQAVALAYLARKVPASVLWRWRVPGSDARRLVRGLVPFTAATVALTAYYKIDVVILEALRGAGEAGVYAAAYKFVDVAQALALVVAMSVYPRLSRAAARATPSERHEPAPAGLPERHDSARAERSASAATRVAELLLLAAVPAAALLWLLRTPIVAVVFGADYGASAAVLAVLAPILPLLALNALGSYVLAAAERMRVVATLFAGALGLNVVLNLLWIPGLGARGAGLAMAASEAALAGAMLVVLGRHAAAPSLRVVGAALAAGGAAVLAARVPLPALAVVALYLAAAAGIYAVARVLAAGEWRLLREAVGR